jgi:NO-binding membrane sensor protein with MHYT domain
VVGTGVVATIVGLEVGARDAGFDVVGAEVGAVVLGVAVVLSHSVGLLALRRHSWSKIKVS